MRQALGHRPLHIGAPEHRTFLDHTRERLERMTSQGVDVRQELRDVQRQLVALPPPRPVRVPEVAVEDDEERIDIGDDATTTDATSTERSAEVAPSQQERRRDGRRNDRAGRDRRDNNRSTPATVAPAEEISEPIVAAADEPVTASVEALLINPEAELLLATSQEGAGYPAKKKKRRSRGGAKRTARKNAARLAEQEIEADASLTDAEILASEEANFADGGPEMTEFAAQNPVEELVVPAPTAEPELAIALGDAAFEEVLLTADDEVTTTQPTRKRGTGPTPKKSKVITKSGQVKRGQRGNLYRTADPEPSAASTPAPTSAPIISPPIIPEVLLERPAADFAMPPEPPVELDLAATVLGLFSSKPKAPAVTTQPKRGRPKAATVAEIAPAAESADKPVESPAAEINTAAEVAEAPAKKASSRSAKAAKPVAAKKAAAKPAAPKKTAAKATAKSATPRKGRSPGKPTPPPADATNP